MDAADDATLVETGIATSNAAGKTAHRTYLCRVTSGKSQGAEIAIGGRPVTIGTQDTCDLILDDPKVSRRHLQLQASARGLRIKDLDSSNGTFTDGVQITDAIAALHDAKSIRCGDTKLRVTIGAVATVAPSRRTRFGALVGESLLMREVFAVLELAAPTDATVLIQGESGTGKELAARALHDHSKRGKAGGPFVVVDCSATHQQLIDSHLFGHKKGAFTGATADRKGAFVAAHEGTLFLDEIGELPLESQAKLLRALEARTIQPLGADEAIKVDTRVVTATHRDLASMVEAETYRFDLFQRLGVVHLLMPPLRERTEDLPSLVRNLYEGRGVDPGPINGAPLELLSQQSWPGNVRELRNVIERSFVLGGAHPFAELQLFLNAPTTTPVSETTDASLPFKEAKQLIVDRFERRYLATIIERYNGNISRAADHAGINRRHFRKLLEQHKLRTP